MTRPSNSAVTTVLTTPADLPSIAGLPLATTLAAEHPFAPYIRKIGKGPHGRRDLSFDEARDALRMILSGQAEPIQIGAFLMVLRVKSETPDEVAGMAAALRETLQLPASAHSAPPDLDWAAYAGKRRHLPWFVLSALLLAAHGVRVLMHGTDGYDPARVFVPDALRALGLQASPSLEHAQQDLDRCGFAFVAVARFCPPLHQLISLRPVLGLRSPLHTVARTLNPLQARATLGGIFHPAYRSVHHGAATLNETPRAAVLKGDGGEAERNPDNPCLVTYRLDGTSTEIEWPALFAGGWRHPTDPTMDPSRLLRVWRGDYTGEASDPACDLDRQLEEYAVAAVTGTAAIAIHLLGLAESIDQAQALAQTWWQQRDRNRLLIPRHPTDATT